MPERDDDQLSPAKQRDLRSFAEHLSFQGCLVLLVLILAVGAVATWLFFFGDWFGGGDDSVNLQSSPGLSTVTPTQPPTGTSTPTATVPITATVPNDTATPSPSPTPRSAPEATKTEAPLPTLTPTPEKAADPAATPTFTTVPEPTSTPTPEPVLTFPLTIPVTSLTNSCKHDGPGKSRVRAGGTVDVATLPTGVPPGTTICGGLTGPGVIIPYTCGDISETGDFTMDWFISVFGGYEATLTTLEVPGTEPIPLTGATTAEITVGAVCEE